MSWYCETCGGEDTIQTDGFMLTCSECGATPQTEPDRQLQVDIASGRLFELVVATRFRNPGTSADPYTDALVLWLPQVQRVRTIVEPLHLPDPTVHDIEYVYRESVESWLRGDEPECDCADDLEHQFRQAINKEDNT